MNVGGVGWSFRRPAAMFPALVELRSLRSLSERTWVHQQLPLPFQVQVRELALTPGTGWGYAPVRTMRAISQPERRSGGCHPASFFRDSKWQARLFQDRVNGGSSPVP